MKNLLVLIILVFGILSCHKQEPSSPNSDEKLTYFYERTENENLQVYSYDGKKETNLSNDPAL